MTADHLSLDRAAPGAARRYTSTYTELAEAVRSTRLLHRRYGYYWTLMVGLVALVGGLVVGVVAVGDSWFQLMLAAGLGVAVAQVGFLGHDAAHRQIFTSPRWNEWTSRLFSGALAGLGYGWWKSKHDRHHARPNTPGKDPDVAPGVIAFYPEAAAGRAEGRFGWFYRRQGWLFFPLLTLEGLHLHIATLRVLTGRARVAHRWTELTLVVSRHAAFAALLLLVMSPGKVAAFTALHLAVVGVLLGGAFAPNHKGMPMVPASMRIDFLRRQVLTSRNIRGGRVVDVMMGGLNHQVEHHLFPDMPRPNLRRVRPIVRDHCRRHDIPYAETGLVASYAIVVRHLNTVGIGARDPFDCPLVGDLRA